MTDTNLIDEIVVLFGTALGVAWLFRAVRVPSIIGFLITGMAIGPSCWQLVSQDHVGYFAELGLVLLLFTVGLELSPEPLVRTGRRLLAVTAGQVAATAAVVAVILSIGTILSVSAKLILGAAIALSSTAIVLKQMSDRGETNSTTGLIMTGILLLQDVLVIALMLILSLVLPDSAGGGGLTRMAIGIGGLLIIIILARRFLRPVLNQITRHGGRELITLFAVLMACGGAWLAQEVGWSPALGACIAGLLLAGADQRHQLVAEITPFRDVFNALFFISLGMLVQTNVIFENAVLLLGAIAATLLLKPVITAATVALAGWPLRIGITVGIGLCTVSEFSYVLAYEAQQVHLLAPGLLDVLVVYTVGTMMAGALLYPLAGPIAASVAAFVQPDVPAQDEGVSVEKRERFQNHVIIVGYGFTGSNLARMLKATHVPHCVVEMNQSHITAARNAEIPVVIGDATRMAILEQAGIQTARALVTAINDHQATLRVVAQAATRRPDLYILARTQFVRDIDRLYSLGAKLVIPEDFETSVEVAAHVLKQFGIPDNIVEAQIAAVRAGGYGMLRGKPTDRAAHVELIKILERTAIQTYYLDDDSYANGRTLAQLDLRARTGCTVIATVRAGQPTTNPPPDFLLQANDVLVLVGAHRQIEAAKALLQHSEHQGA
jgi:CPA2 family monovalent cation:H+ antiporter-2